MKEYKKTIIAVMMSFMMIQGWAQISFGGLPVSFTKAYLSEDVPIVDLQKPELTPQMLQAASSKDKLYHVAQVLPLDLTTNDIGKTDLMSDGSKVWRVCFNTQDAYFTNVSFRDFQIPEGAELFVYTPDKKWMIGKFTSESVLDDYVFYTQSVPGSELVIEYNEPADVAFQGHFKITGVQYGFVDIFNVAKSGAFGQSEACEIDVQCQEGRLFPNQINSVIHYQVTIENDTYMCSGALINTTRNDNTPYVLSAHHCISGGTVTQFVAYFNYEANTCGGTVGPTDHTAIGMKIIATDDDVNSSDFLLMKITGRINANYNLYFAGWDRSQTTPTIGACIHHPSGDFKKISLPSKVHQGEYVLGYRNYWGVKWRTGTANKGVTEGGSSGSPLFNSQRRIVGSLYGGSSSCETPSNTDYYGKLAYSWDNGYEAAASKKLSPWLDPDNTGAVTCDGIPLAIRENVKQAYITLSVYPNPAKDKITVKGLQFSDEGLCRIYSVLGQMLYQSTIRLDDDLDIELPILQSGIYYLEILNSEQRYSAKLVIEQD